MPKLYQKNAKKHPDKQLKLIANSLKEFGWRQPILVDKNDEIIVGHGRWMAYQKYPEGIKEPWIVKADDLTDEQVKAYRLADNKLNESEWEMGLAIEELKELSPEMVELTGFDKDLLIEPDEKDDEVPEIPEEPKSKLGDLYELGSHRVLAGDSTKIEDVERLMDGKKADMVFTDPPYGIDIVGSDGKIGKEKLAKSGIYSKVIGDETTDTAEKFYKTSVELGFKKFIIWGGNYFLKFLPFGYWLVWDKRGDMTSNKFADGEMAWTNIKTRLRIYKQIWAGMIREGEHNKRLHPTQKPVMTLENIIKDFTKENDIVYDGFLGSGSTLISSEKTGRICYGMELDPRYTDVIVQRYVDYTGNENIIKNGEPIIWPKSQKTPKIEEN